MPNFKTNCNVFKEEMPVDKELKLQVKVQGIFNVNVGEF